MRSLSAWGEIQIAQGPKGVLEGKALADARRSGSLTRLATARVDAGIGIDFDDDTREVRIQLSFCNVKDSENPEIGYVKRETYRRLKTDLDLALPATLFWKGRYLGDPGQINKTFMKPVTSRFYDLTSSVFTRIKASGSKGNENIIFSRDWTDVVVIRRALLLFLEEAFDGIAERDTGFLPSTDFGTELRDKDGKRGHDMFFFLAEDKKIRELLAAEEKEMDAEESSVESTSSDFGIPPVGNVN